MVVPGFPNLFLVSGPSSHDTTSAIFVGGRIMTIFPSTATVFWLMCRVAARVIVRTG